MTNVKRFEDLLAWQRARVLVREIHFSLREGPERETLAVGIRFVPRPSLRCPTSLKASREAQSVNSTSSWSLQVLRVAKFAPNSMSHLTWATSTKAGSKSFSRYATIRAAFAQPSESLQASKDRHARIANLNKPTIQRFRDPTIYENRAKTVALVVLSWIRCSVVSGGMAKSKPRSAQAWAGSCW